MTEYTVQARPTSLSIQPDAVPGTSQVTPGRQGASNLQRRPAPSNGQKSGPNSKKRKPDAARVDKEADDKERLEYCKSIGKTRKELEKMEADVVKLQKAIKAHYNTLINYTRERENKIKRSGPYSECTDPIVQGGGALPENSSGVNEPSESSPSPQAVNSGGEGDEGESVVAALASTDDEGVEEEEEGGAVRRRSERGHFPISS
ncbi:uncharacterized protein LOC129334484 [Eublepharis macularius]|uniref:Uncharacterized protein LOC129334484 n=1 Tax=Eublepharis macularius TaxID=481883 RepID=A0AA97L586_EUBMA|nr:uncharacterized protein LOC129334484 [Eublepharis macularius]